VLRSKNFTLIAYDVLSILKKGGGVDSLIIASDMYIIGLIKVKIILFIFKFLLKEDYYYV